jgi:hypothetical protein
LHVVTHHLFVGSAKYFTPLKIGHCFTQSFESKSEYVPYETGQIETQRLTDGSPTQSVGQAVGMRQTRLYPYVVELHLFTHLLKLSFCANNPLGHVGTHNLPLRGS